MRRLAVAHDEDLADWVRAALPPGDAVTERRMFGGLAFLIRERAAARPGIGRPGTVRG
jgi:hypothetical protein